MAMRIKDPSLELERLKGLTLFERQAYDEGYQMVAGMDEVGRGCLAGPVLACCLIFPREISLHELFGVNDSKKLSEKKREQLFSVITACSSFGIGMVDEETIDQINILQASHRAMNIAAAALDKVPDCVLVDGSMTVTGLEIFHKPIIKGDGLSLSIAAASIVAKVTRDRLMQEYHKQYPQYGFDQNKGYGTKAHMAALERFGPCPIHRRSFLREN